MKSYGRAPTFLRGPGGRIRVQLPRKQHEYSSIVHLRYRDCYVLPFDEPVRLDICTGEVVEIYSSVRALMSNPCGEITLQNGSTIAYRPSQRLIVPGRASPRPSGEPSMFVRDGRRPLYR